MRQHRINFSHSEKKKEWRWGLAAPRGRRCCEDQKTSSD